LDEHTSRRCMGEGDPAGERLSRQAAGCGGSPRTCSSQRTRVILPEPLPFTQIRRGWCGGLIARLSSCSFVFFFLFERKEIDLISCRVTSRDRPIGRSGLSLHRSRSSMCMRVPRAHANTLTRGTGTAARSILIGGCRAVGAGVWSPACLPRLARRGSGLGSRPARETFAMRHARRSRRGKKGARRLVADWMDVV
jgi:hypothetical protein